MNVRLTNWLVCLSSVSKNTTTINQTNTLVYKKLFRYELSGLYYRFVVEDNVAIHLEASNAFALLARN